MKCKVACYIIAAIATLNTNAQIFSNDVWEQKNFASLKVSQLYYEANIGINLFPQKQSADFIYFAFGYGKPTKKNAWRKFTPENQIIETWPKSLKEKINNNGTNGLHAGKIGIGWNHWFNHIIGCYIQAGWGFVADLSTGDNFTAEEKVLLSNVREKSTLIYNTVPVEIGLTLNLWKHYQIQGGVTYMWKEIPLLTIGIGYAF